ncbi:hypothetical protein PTSG_00834 [Salpingoeca rosetta]|uniref:Cyclic nucleotide-binding domain-containing protein n=1 Tax=Salpingoeca rosetta (strain ATCC 50818 / BSB-021) TaxID=946362 RepID=F2TXL8_SALR5|nr:uncharacterized protein PTSG_00834 [Salpingoeca rosetta]EGD76127.1 hypothetical protein PTSG_00834 [Salpingoeca rosetta]|eukprot:XP_004998302.1 hypothetical protein PTSG_00834 [Salpingoeca rosetta]
MNLRIRLLFRRLIRTLYRDVAFQREMAKGRPQKRLKPDQIAALRRLPSKRTKRQRHLVRMMVESLECFRKYQNLNFEDMAEILHYEARMPGDLLLRQGDPGYGFYFIASGKVEVRIKDPDAVDGYRVVNELGAGVSFGEVALLDPTNRRSASIVCKEACEFLRVERDEFDTLLRQYHQREFDAKLSLYRDHGNFDGWHERALRVVVRDTHRMAFRQGRLIALGSKEPGTLNRGPQTFIVASGKAQILRKLHVVLDTTTGRVTLAKQRDSRMRALHLQHKAIWLASEPLKVGDVVPYMSDTTALVSEGCEVLYVPQTSFLFRDNGTVLDDIFKRSYILSASDKELFKQYNQLQRWDWFCFQMREDLKQGVPTSAGPPTFTPTSHLSMSPSLSSSSSSLSRSMLPAVRRSK